MRHSPRVDPPLTCFLGVPLKRGAETIGLIAVADNPRGYGPEHLQALQAIAPVVREAFARRRAEDALRLNELENVARQERNRLARDLHDSVTQALFAATIKAEALTLDPDASSAVTATAEEVRRLTRGALAQMRTLLLELRSDPVHEIPLRQLLRHLVEAAESRAGTSVRLTVRGEAVVPPEVHVMLYRVAQEGLNNVARHARAENAWVVVDLEPSSARLVVGDDGVGFDSRPGAGRAPGPRLDARAGRRGRRRSPHRLQARRGDGGRRGVARRRPGAGIEVRRAGLRPAPVRRRRPASAGRPVEALQRRARARRRHARAHERRVQDADHRGVVLAPGGERVGLVHHAAPPVAG